MLVVALALSAVIVLAPTPATSEPASHTHGSPHSQSRPAAPAADRLATTLPPLLGHHVTLTTRFMRATVSADPGLVDTADAALVRNTADLEQALQVVIGADDAATFAAQWATHTQALFRYATGVRDNDETVKREAHRQLDDYIREQSRLLHNLTDGRLERKTAAQRLRRHIKQLIGQIDAYAVGAHRRAYGLQYKAYEHMFAVGEVLAAALTDGSGQRALSPADELGIALARLFGEHVELVVETTRAGVRGGSEFQAAAGALNSNTKAIAMALDGLFGDERAQELNNLWADHIDLLIEYSVAVADTDTYAATSASARLEGLRDRFGATLADVTAGEVDAAVAADFMATHSDHLLRQIKAYAGNDYRSAHDIAYAAYQESGRAAIMLAEGFAGALSQGLPEGGAATGGGGTALQQP